MTTKIISTRVENKIVLEIGDIARKRNMRKTAVIREIMKRGIKEVKKEEAVERYRTGKITAWKASEVAGIALWEFIDIVKREKIPLKYTMDDAKEDIKQVFGEI